MPSFHEIRFPLPLSFGASGGPQRRTEIITLANGHEQRNSAQANSRRRYDVGVGIKTLGDMHTLIAFFEARMGQLYGFRFRDPVDFKSCAPDKDITHTEQSIGIGDGAQSIFQLTKTYEDAQGSYTRIISKPVPSKIHVGINGQVETAFTLDDTSGKINFDSPPVNGALISAGFEFDVPVRFDTEQLSTSLESFGAGGAAHIPLVEILTHA